jgi:hypothetical protein
VVAALLGDEALELQALDQAAAVRALTWRLSASCEADRAANAKPSSARTEFVAAYARTGSG